MYKRQGYLQGADIDGANLQYAILTSADFYNANLTDAYLQYANFTDAINTNQADFTDTSWYQTVWIDGVAYDENQAD